MGYTTDFTGKFTLNKKLDKKTHEFLLKLNMTRRMGRKGLPEAYGVEGEFYVDGKGDMGQDHDDHIIDYNRPPKTQPSLWCQWRPTEDGRGIEWDEGEKFYNYIEWIEYIIEKILKPRGYVLNGDVEWRGENSDDQGTIHVVDNTVDTATLEEKMESLEKILAQKKLLPGLLGLTPWLDRQIAARISEGK